MRGAIDGRGRQVGGDGMEAVRAPDGGGGVHTAAAANHLLPA